MKENKALILSLLRIIAPVALIAAITTNEVADDLVHVRLKDRLDRPVDGYCLDILGTGQNLRLDVPLFVHNCKGGLTPDSAVVYTQKGQLVFPAANVCVTAFGVNNTVLPGTSILLRPCNQRVSFFNATELQKFDYLHNGQFKLRGSELCLAVGNEASSTYSPHDRWRVLSLQSCANTELSHSAWEIVNP